MVLVLWFISIFFLESNTQVVYVLQGGVCGSTPRLLFLQ